MKYTYHVDNGCTLCGMCVAECGQGAIALGPRGARIDQARCIGCGACFRNCASEAIRRREVQPAREQRSGT
jgi:ferredoxin